MYDLNLQEFCSLHQETICRQAITARLLRSCQPHRLNLTDRSLAALGETLIRLGQQLKDAHRHLQAEPVPLSSLTIIQ